jgi:hypothetical protein
MLSNPTPSAYGIAEAMMAFYGCVDGHKLDLVLVVTE